MQCTVPCIPFARGSKPGDLHRGKIGTGNLEPAALRFVDVMAAARAAGRREAPRLDIDESRTSADLLIWAAGLEAAFDA
jgi:hypothetical protein